MHINIYIYIYTYTYHLCVCIYIYIYMAALERKPKQFFADSSSPQPPAILWGHVTVEISSPPTKSLDFRGLDSSTILIQRGGIPRPIGIS